MSGLRHFLLVFDHQAGRLVERREFGDGEEAVAAYANKEREYEKQERVEVVLISSDSIETVKRTHGNYFGLPSLDGSAPVAKYLQPAPLPALRSAAPARPRAQGTGRP